MLARRYDIHFYFFSGGTAWYWPREHGVHRGRFRGEDLSGFSIGQTRITPALPWKLLRGDYDLYIKCINGRFALPVTFLVARLRHRPFILWTGIWDRLGTPVQRLMFPLTRAIYRGSDAIVVYGEHVRRYLIGEGVKAERIFVASHATDNRFYGKRIATTAKQALRRRLGLKRGQKIVLYVGRLEPSKGVEYLMQAFADLGRLDTTLLIVGSGSGRQALEGIAKRRGISGRVRFVGYVPIESVPLYHALASVLVLPSITTPAGKEPWGLVVNEAFNQGVPVVATRAVGAAAGGLLIDRVNGLVVPEGDRTALAGALGTILGSPQLRKKWGRSARKTVGSWDYLHNVQGYESAIEFVKER